MAVFHRHKFHPGDIIRVKSREEIIAAGGLPNGSGWVSSFGGGMWENCGRTFTVESVMNDNSVTLVEDKNGFIYENRFVEPVRPFKEVKIDMGLLL